MRERSPGEKNTNAHSKNNNCIWCFVFENEHQYVYHFAAIDPNPSQTCGFVPNFVITEFYHYI